jgi:hypothetical protein
METRKEERQPVDVEQRKCCHPKTAECQGMQQVITRAQTRRNSGKRGHLDQAKIENQRQIDNKCQPQNRPPQQ